MKVFVTGGSGFVGGHVIEALAPDHEVQAMARSDEAAAKVVGFGARAVRVDLDAITADHLAGVDAVVHSAAFVEEWGPHERYEQINVHGTQRLLDAARAAGVRRFVLVSTNATVFDPRGARDVDERAPYPAHRGFSYGATKAEAERRVLAADREGFTTLAVRPCFVWGPRDNSILPALRRTAAAGGFVWIDGGRALVSTTHIANLVAAVQRALVAGRGGQAYFVADDGDVTIRTFVGGIAAADGLVLPDRALPGGVVRGVAGLLAGLYRLVGAASPPPITPMAAALMSSDMTVRTAKARDELGWAPVIDRRGGLSGLASVQGRS